MIGIYKITSPTKKIYIGQSVNIKQRFKYYYSESCPNQRILHNSLKKYGAKKHKFEIIDLCCEQDLNEKERYYQELFNAMGPNGMNCKLTKAKDRSGKLSEATRKKISASNTGKKQSAEHGRKISELKKGNKNRLGMTHTPEVRKAISEKLKGRKIPEEVRLKYSIAGKNKVFSETHRKNISIARKGIVTEGTLRTLEIMRQHNTDILLNELTGIYYYGLAEAAFSANTNKSTLTARINGRLKNNTNIIKV